MRNRRNYYRVLHTQHDAPAAVIKSCYRALMRTLEMHPDRGGDHWNAALLNEAYSVLSCDERRADYDRTLFRQPRESDLAAAAASSQSRVARLPSAEGAADAFCAFCGRPHGLAAGECTECDSPLTISAEWMGRACGRRARARLAVDREVRLHTDWPSTRPISARIRDLSPGGLRLETDVAIEPHRIVKLESDALHAVARVAHCRVSPADPGRAVVGAEFFTLRLPRMTGVFLSVSG